MTRATRSMPVAPATMCLTNFSWPGTSTMPGSDLPAGRDEQIQVQLVMPRSFSSLRRFCINTCHGFHQRGLAMIDVSRSTRMTCFIAFSRAFSKKLELIGLFRLFIVKVRLSSLPKRGRGRFPEGPCDGRNLKLILKGNALPCQAKWERISSYIFFPISGLICFSPVL